MLAVAVALAVVAVVAGIVPGAAGGLTTRAVGAAPAPVVRAGGQLALAFGEGAVLWAMTFAAAELLRRSTSSRRAAAAALLSAVPILACRRIAQTADERVVLPPTPFARAVEGLDAARSFRTVDESIYRARSPLDPGDRGDPGGNAYFRRSWFLHTPALWDRGVVFNSDLDAGDLSRVESLRRIAAFMAASPGSAPFFESLGLRFGIRFRDQAPLPGFRRFGGDAMQDWDESPGVLPTVRLVAGWREESDSLEALRALPSLPPGRIVLETGGSRAGAAPPGELRLESESGSGFAARVRLSAPGWLFALRGHWPYRRVTVDGARVESVPAQLAFSAIPIAAGEHRVEWREEVPGWSVARFGPLVFAGAASALLWRRPGRRSGV
jgi:hypothetical protein